MKRIIFLFVIYIIISTTSFGQEALKRSFNEATRFLFFENYGEALKYLSIAYKSEPDNANVNHLIGLCIINSPIHKEKAIPYLLKAVKNITPEYEKESYKEKRAPIEAYLYLGQAYHYNYQFDKAIAAFNKYKELLPDNSEEKLEKAKHYLYWCMNAKEMMRDSAEIKITNIAEVNTKFDEHTPVISSDETVMIFTSRRPGSTGNIRTDDGRFFEDIYISKKENEKWGVPVKISENINSNGHEATIALSADGKELFIYKDDYGVGNIYSSKLEGNNIWSKPQKLGSNVNTSSNETHATITSDINTLVFVSDRKEGYGKTDLYIVRCLPNNEWGFAQNIGNVVNTKYEEEGAFIHQDGTFLFFSSKGHNSMGGFDLFYSELQDDSTWSEPTNLGYPINTTGDDVFYVLSSDGKRAYYSSLKEGGMGGRDIYQMDLLSLPERSSTVIMGYIRLAGTKKIQKEVTVTVLDLKTDKVYGIYRPNKTTGLLTMILRQGKEYRIMLEVEGRSFKEDRLVVPGNSSLFETNDPILIETIGTVD